MLNINNHHITAEAETEFNEYIFSCAEDIEFKPHIEKDHLFHYLVNIATVKSKKRIQKWLIFIINR